MKTRKILLILLTALMLFAPSVHASEAINVSIDLSTGDVTVTGVIPSGESGKTVTMLVTNPNFDNEDVATNPSALQNQKETVSTEGGAYRFSFRIYMDESEAIDYVGDYHVYVGGDDYETPAVESFYYATKEDRQNAIKAINDATSASQMKQLVSDYKEVLYLHSAPFDSIDYTALAAKLYQHVQQSPFDMNNESALQSWVLENSVVEAYNQSKADVVYAADGTFLYPEIVGFHLLDSDARNLTVYDTYQNLLSDKAKAAVRENLLGNQCENVQELQEIFIQQVVLQGIKGAKNDGFGHINALLKNNGAAAGLNLSQYNSLSSTGNVDSQLPNQSFNTIPQLNDVISNIIKELEVSPDINHGGGGGGVGGTSNYRAISDSSFTVSGDVVTDVQTQPLSRYFSDLDDVEWAREAVEALTRKGAISIVENGIFRPNDAVTREEFVKMLVLTIDADITEIEVDFTDVTMDDWFAPYLAAAKNLGIITGNPDGSFGVGSPITREDIAVMTYRAINSIGMELAPQDNNPEFTDMSSCFDYAVEGVSYLTRTGIINGMGDGTFAPKSECTRAQAAKILFGILD